MQRGEPLVLGEVGVESGVGEVELVEEDGEVGGGAAAGHEEDGLRKRGTFVVVVVCL